MAGLETNFNRLPRGGSPYRSVLLFHHLRSSTHTIVAPIRNIVNTRRARYRSVPRNRVAPSYIVKDVQARMMRKTRVAFTVVPARGKYNFVTVFPLP